MGRIGTEASTIRMKSVPDEPDEALSHHIWTGAFTYYSYQFLRRDEQANDGRVDVVRGEAEEVFQQMCTPFGQ
jgi:hypothetical protein